MYYMYRLLIYVQYVSYWEESGVLLYCPIEKDASAVEDIEHLFCRYLGDVLYTIGMCICKLAICK